MPLQWKIYCVCNVYVFLWGTVFFFMLLYDVLISHLTDDDAFFHDFSIGLLFWMPLKAILSLKSVRHYRKGTLPQKWERRLIQISFCVSVIAICFLILISLTLLVGFTLHPSDFISHDEKFPFRALDFVRSILLATFCTVFINALDISVLKAISEKYYAGLILAEDSVNKLKL